MERLASVHSGIWASSSWGSSVLCGIKYNLEGKA